MPDSLPHPRALSDLDTPCLVLDVDRLDRNLQRLATHLHRLGVPLRPHVKTAKSIPIVQRALNGQPGGVTVSTLREAEACLTAGITDMLYAVGIAPLKLRRVAALQDAGASITIIVDSLDAAHAVQSAGISLERRFPTLIELDTDGHRAGVLPDSPLLLEIGRALGAHLRGVMTHAGESYSCVTVEAKRTMAERERRGAVVAAERLRASGFPCAVVSVGSTPTALFADDLSGVTEVRAGVHMFMDLVMAGIGVCTTDDIAISVLTTVIGHQVEKGWILIDAGWMALSRDRGTATQARDCGYGLVCDVEDRVHHDLMVIGANQEHGIIAVPGPDPRFIEQFPLGMPLRILPNHACATAAQFGEYHLVSDGQLLAERWPRFAGW